MDGICSSANAVMVGENIYYAQTYIRKWNNRRVYYHVYYDKERHIREKRLLMRKVLQHPSEKSYLPRLLLGKSLFLRLWK